MTSQKWADIRPEVVEELGGELAVAEARRLNQASIDAHRLAARRLSLGITQADVAKRMGVTKSRVSQIERGDVSTVDVVSRYIDALGGHVQIAAVFGDDLLILRGSSTKPA
ncbi:hypothetical protein GCM10009715_27430 [Paeniglutamicibacter psychrophenolicus]|uniref:DNA-binding XRE family transcriptional regulator n=1 Tax=Paeniglutamicibacter psychrophenolicus TaxID=257454 RepID=A0ABS4WEV0_9MICC|nr:DNA-binding XRE family transcriptional regulator [Paeniglutamicibacter psychrophenolicus]